MNIIDKLWSKYTSKGFWIGLIKMGAVCTFFLHVGAASIYYIYNTIWIDAGIQPDMFSSITLVLFTVGGAFIVSKKVLTS